MASRTVVYEPTRTAPLQRLKQTFAAIPGITMPRHTPIRAQWNRFQAVPRYTVDEYMYYR
jgi:hypothetical protein